MVADRKNWLEQYRRGDRAAVWSEFRALGADVRRPEYLADAEAVCDEMARRARHNIELIVTRLVQQGYRFHSNDDDQASERPFTPPTTHAAAQVEWLTRAMGPIPLALSSWVRLVGDVWLVGTHPEWPESDSADPLTIDIEGARHPQWPSTRGYFADEWEAWRERAAEDPTAGPYVLPVSPDILHKANTSGGDPYGFRLPDASAEGVFVTEAPMPFVDYLNHVFAHGGFPGPAWAPAAEAIKRSLARDLLPL